MRAKVSSIVSQVISILLTGLLPSFLTSLIPIPFTVLAIIICVLLAVIFSLIQAQIIGKTTTTLEELNDFKEENIKLKQLNSDLEQELACKKKVN